MNYIILFKLHQKPGEDDKMNTLTSFITQSIAGSEKQETKTLELPQ